MKSFEVSWSIVCLTMLFRFGCELGADDNCAEAKCEAMDLTNAGGVCLRTCFMFFL